MVKKLFKLGFDRVSTHVRLREGLCHGETSKRRVEKAENDFSSLLSFHF